MSNYIYEIQEHTTEGLLWGTRNYYTVHASYANGEFKGMPAFRLSEPCSSIKEAQRAIQRSEARRSDSKVVLSVHGTKSVDNCNCCGSNGYSCQNCGGV
mgnify:CR=1 FL=1